MPAIGFGQKVTGGGDTPARIIVTRVGSTGTGITLAKAIDMANKASKRSAGYPAQEILIAPLDGTEVPPHTADLTVTARNLTIRAANGVTINRNHLVFDCETSDNVILTNLSFTSDGESDPPDTISIDGTRGRHGTGFWIHHCSFEAYRDLSITSNTRDIRGARPLLITVSHCRFHDADPNGQAHRNHGALGIHGYEHKNKVDKHTNAYATVVRNVFDHVRRRSPRSSHLTVVDAFNNVLLDWGTNRTGTDATDAQQNGMEAGHAGILLASANYFKPNVLTETIGVASTQPPRLTLGTGTEANRYVVPAVGTPAQGAPIVRQQIYTDALGSAAVVPTPVTIDDALVATIRTEAGASAA